MPEPAGWTRHLPDIIAAVLGVAAFAASFTHVRQVAASHGQVGWVAWAIAASVELLALVAMLEMRRKLRTVPVLCLALGAALSVAANLETSDGTLWGGIMAGWPAAAFLATVALVETRPERRPTRRPRKAQRDVQTVPGGSRPAPTGQQAVAVTQVPPRPATPPSPPPVSSGRLELVAPAADRPRVEDGIVAALAVARRTAFRVRAAAMAGDTAAIDRLAAAGLAPDGSPLPQHGTGG